MNRFIKYFYVFITSIFVLLTLYEIILYLRIDSNYVGVFYLFFNFFVMFLLFTITINYETAKRNIRISKNIFAIIVGIFNSFLLTFVLTHIFSYTDSSYLFTDSIFVISKIIKPIIYLSLGAISVIEIKFIK